MKTLARTAPLAALFCLASPVSADPVLRQPIDCTLGESCFIQHHVDLDPTPSVQDFRCGALSYDGHKGTDYALPSLARMQQGVEVLAAAPGVVRGLRDGMADRIYRAEDAADVTDRECGNGLVLDHGGGWTSQYCHMKRGSLQVRRGQRVAAGAVLGQVGLSGKTQFPHLHFSLRHEGQVIDPYRPEAQGAPNCETDTPAQPLWQDAPPYQPGGLIALGFADRIPGFDQIKAGTAVLDQPDTEMPALVAWAYLFGVEQGDVLDLDITGPEGRVTQKRIALTKSQAQVFRAIGRKRPEGGWTSGRYTALARLWRGDRVLSESREMIDLP